VSAPSVVLAAILAAAAALIAYSYLGYPLLLALRARFRPAPAVARSSITPEVSLVLVVHDEERLLAGKLDNCLDLDYPRDRLDVVVVSDGSTDRSEDIIRSYADRGVRLLALPGPNGKAVALNHAVPGCRGDIIVLCDARQSLAREAVRELVAGFADPTVGAVSGELHIAPRPGGTEGVGFYWRYEKLIRRAESAVDSVVGVTGAIYAIRKELFRPLDPRTILDDVAIPMRVVLGGHRVLFEPRARAYDQAAASAAREFRRKVRTLAGNYQMIRLYPEWLDPRRNRLLWQLASHKLSRLLVPWCGLAMLLASIGLVVRDGGRFAWALLAGQILFYLLAALGQLLADRPRLPRLLAVPHALVLLNLAAAFGLFAFLRRSEQAAWKAGRR
jgi:cellulose synthase/poly-beta-1,6-N-acetylglucosamine synthase-like glycosyltransferase